MNELKTIKNDKLKTYIFNCTVAFGLLSIFVGVFIASLLNDESFGLLCAVIGIMVLPLLFVVLSKEQRRFSGNKIGCNVYSFKHISYEDLLLKVHDYAMNHGYLNKDKLVTCRSEEFTVYFKDIPDYLEYPKEKICVYRDYTYKAELWKHVKTAKYQYDESRPNYTYGKAEQIKFQKMVCGNWGRNYKYPKEWVDVETILIIMVDEWNETLNWVMNQSGNLPFVLVALMIKSDPDVIYVTKDIRKRKREDYLQKCSELFDLLDVRNRCIIRNMIFSEGKKRITPQDEDRLKNL